MELSNDQKAILRLLAQRGAAGYDDLTALMGLDAAEVHERAKAAAIQLEAEGIPAPSIPAPPATGSAPAAKPAEPAPQVPAPPTAAEPPSRAPATPVSSKPPHRDPPSRDRSWHCPAATAPAPRWPPRSRSWSR